MNTETPDANYSEFKLSDIAFRLNAGRKSIARTAALNAKLEQEVLARYQESIMAASRLPMTKPIFSITDVEEGFTITIDLTQSPMQITIAPTAKTEDETCTQTTSQQQTQAQTQAPAQLARAQKKSALLKLLHWLGALTPVAKLRSMLKKHSL